jgi:hypothetical protein
MPFLLDAEAFEDQIKQNCLFSFLCLLIMYSGPELKHSDTVLNSIKDGWFTENCELLKRKSGIAGIENALNSANCDWKSLYTGERLSVGQRFSLQVEEVLAAGKSDFQVHFDHHNCQNSQHHTTSATNIGAIVLFVGYTCI